MDLLFSGNQVSSVVALADKGYTTTVREPRESHHKGLEVHRIRNLKVDGSTIQTRKHSYVSLQCPSKHRDMQRAEVVDSNMGSCHWGVLILLAGNGPMSGHTGWLQGRRFNLKQGWITFLIVARGCRKWQVARRLCNKRFVFAWARLVWRSRILQPAGCQKTRRCGVWFLPGEKHTESDRQPE